MIYFAVPQHQSNGNEIKEYVTMIVIGNEIGPSPEGECLTQTKTIE